MSVIDRATLVLVAFFITSRALLYPLYPFRLDYLPWLNQLLDVEILKYNLIEGLYHLHATPPLYNALIGVFLQAFPNETALAVALQSLYAVLALATALMVERIARYLGASEWWAMGAGLLVVLNPIFFRFEIIPFYTLPLAFLITFSVYALVRTAQTSSFWYGAAFLVSIAITVLFRNFFHVIVFMLPAVALFVYTARAWTRAHVVAIALVACLCLGIALVPSVMNYTRYGMFTSSTWQGMQLYSMTYHVPEDKIEALVATGAVTPLALLPRFQNPDTYYAYYKEPVRDEIPALDALFKTGTEFGNFNNKIFVRTSEEYGQNARTIMSYYPWYFVPKFVNSAYIFFGVANYRYFTSVDEWMVFDGSWYRQLYQATKYFIQPALLAMVFFSIIGYLVWALYGTVRSKKWGDHAIVYAYLLFIFMYVFGVANVVELGENFTARIPIDPILTACAVVLFYRLRTRHLNAVV